MVVNNDRDGVKLVMEEEIRAEPAEGQEDTRNVFGVV